MTISEERLAEIVKREVRWNVGNIINLFAVLDDVHKVYIVNSIRIEDRIKTAVVVTVRIAGDKVIIEKDRTDKPLVDALLQAGIPRDQIILAYAGEAVPEA